MLAVAGCGLLVVPPLALADPFTAPNGSFTVDFPAPPVSKQSEKRTFVGRIHEVWFELSSERGYFLVGYTRLPELIVFFGGQDRVLDHVKQIILDKESAQEKSYKSAKINGRAGKVLTFRKEDGESGKAFFVFEKRQVFLVMAYSSHGLGPVDHFVDSFQLLEPQGQ